MNKIKSIILSLIIIVSSVLGVQSTTPKFKFLNCDWGMSPEQVITVLQDRAKSLKEDLSLKDEDKAIGLRNFKSDKKVEKIVFAEINWDFIKLRFLDNKLAEVQLWCEGLDGYKLREEFIAKFGVLSHLDSFEGMRIERWEAEDKSALTLTMFDSVLKLNIQNVVSVSFAKPNFASDVYERSQELKKSKKSEWENPEAAKVDQSPKVEQSSKKAFKFLNLGWGISAEIAISSLNESLGVVVKEKLETDKREREIDKLMGAKKFGMDNFEFGGFPWRFRLVFYDNKLVHVELKTFDKEKVNEVQIVEEIELKYGKCDESSYFLEEVMQWDWKGEEGSELSVCSAPRFKSVTWDAPGYFEEYKKRRDAALKKLKTKW